MLMVEDLDKLTEANALNYAADGGKGIVAQQTFALRLRLCVPRTYDNALSNGYRKLS